MMEMSGYEGVVGFTYSTVLKLEIRPVDPIWPTEKSIWFLFCGIHV
jgi:hypothetical protein